MTLALWWFLFILRKNTNSNHLIKQQIILPVELTETHKKFLSLHDEDQLDRDEYMVLRHLPLGNRNNVCGPMHWMRRSLSPNRLIWNYKCIAIKLTKTSKFEKPGLWCGYRLTNVNVLSHNSRVLIE